MNAPRRILIIRLSALGDILHTLPAFTDLRTSFPEAEIDWLVARKSEFLLSIVKGIDAVHSVDAAALLRFPPDRAAWRRARDLVRALRARRYDVAIDFQGLLKTAFLTAASGAVTRLGFSRELARERPAHWFYHRTLPKPDREVHVLELNRMLAGLAGSSRTPGRRPDLIVSDAVVRSVESLLKREQLDEFVVINPGGGWPTKMWHPERYGLLAARVQRELGLPVVVTTGPGEERLFREIAEKCGSPAPRHFPVSFIELVPLLRRARLLIGGDTGPFHLACALGTPVVGVFGPTSPIRNGPWGTDDAVAVNRLDCSFCYGRICSIGAVCMDVTVDEVFTHVVRRLTQSHRSADPE